MRTPADSTSSAPGALAALERMAEKSAANVVAAIEKSKRHDAWRASSSRSASATSARRRRKDLARHFGSLDALMAADEAELAEAPDVGPVVAESIARFFAEPHNREVIAGAARGRRALARCDAASARRRASSPA